MLGCERADKNSDRRFNILRLPKKSSRAIIPPIFNLCEALQ
jgi:hypothetical protein